MPYVVALTGGIAAGKSAVERAFAALNVAVYDADQAARAVVEPGSQGLAEIERTFGREALDSTGHLDRALMRKRIFSNPEARKELEAIVHPRVRQWLANAVEANHDLYCVISIPLLAEHVDHYRWVDRILVVDTSAANQLTRLLLRDGIDEDLALKMMANQASRDARLAIADDVIENNADESALALKVQALNVQYLEAAKRKQ